MASTRSTGRRRARWASSERQVRACSTSARSALAVDRSSPVAGDQVRLLEALVDQEALERGVVLEVALLLAALDPVERRLGDVEVALLDDVGEVAVEEGEQQGADVRAVDVGVGHDDDLVVAQLAEVEVVADAGAQGGDQRADLLAAQHLVEPGALDVEDLAAQAAGSPGRCGRGPAWPSRRRCRPRR